MLHKVVRFLKYWFGDFTKEELKKYLFLGVIFSLLIGTYWTLRPMKDSFFGQLVVGYGEGKKEGSEVFLAVAKVISLLLLIPIVTIYGKLVERFQKNHFFYMITGGYAILMAVWTAIFLSPTLGLANTEASHWRIAGWLWYVFVESFGSLVIALFWAIVVDTTTASSAKRGFALIVMIGQLGGIILPHLLKLPKMYAFSPAYIVAICGLLVFLTMVLFWRYVQTTPKELFASVKVSHDVKKEQEPGLMEGLTLVLSHGYLMGIFGILFFFEFIATVIDFNFKSLVFSQMPDVAAATHYLGVYGSSVNTVAFLCLLFGINNIPRLLGLTAALGLVPLVVAAAVVAFWWSPSLDVLFYLIVGAKAINYALNGPSIKQLYIPTSEDVKYKSQAWIETFGSRASKAAASFANLGKAPLGTSLYISLTVALSLGLSAVWFFVAIYLARRCNQATEREEIVC